MSFVTAVPVPETTIGIAKETTRHTAVAPTQYLPVMGPKYKPNRQFLPDETLQGSMVKTYDEIPGLRYDSHGWDSYLYLDSFPVLLQALLGSADTVVAAPASTTLSSAAAVGAATISTATTIAAGSWFTIDTGSLIEARQCVSVTGTGPYTVTLSAPTAFPHASGAAVTGLTAHKFSLLNNSPSTGNQPPSYTISDFGGETGWRQLPGAQLSTLNISGAADALTKYACEWFADPSTTPTAPTPSFTTAEAPPGFTSVLKINGTQVSYVQTFEFDLGRGVQPIPGLTGNQSYLQYFAGPLTAAAKITVLEDLSSTWLNAYDAGTPLTIDFTTSDVKSGWVFNLHSSSAKFTSGELDRSKEYSEVPLDLMLLPTATDALAGGVSPLVVTVANAQTISY